MIPVARSSSASAAKQTIAQAEELAEHGRGVIVYPEGSLTREPDLWPMRGKTGAARIALQTRCPVIPLAQWGGQAILGPYESRPHFLPIKEVTVVAGPPVDLSDLHDRPMSREVLEEATRRIMAAITGLLEEIRGEQAPAEVFDPRAKGVPTTGPIVRHTTDTSNPNPQENS